MALPLLTTTPPSRLSRFGFFKIKSGQPLIKIQRFVCIFRQSTIAGRHIRPNGGFIPGKKAHGRTKLAVVFQRDGVKPMVACKCVNYSLRPEGTYRKRQNWFQTSKFEIRDT